jgi:ribose transport system substrate-binding protein
MSSKKVYKLAVVPKETINPFYDQVHEGCQDMAGLLPNTECVYVGPDSVYADEQASIIRKLINSSSVDGISMAVIDAQIASELAQEALDANIPFITFDSDARTLHDLCMSAQDNFEFGQSLAKVLLQLSPKGGVYGIIDASPPNIALRSDGFRYRLQNSRWVESPASPKDCLDSINISLQHMHDYAALAPHMNAIIPVGGWPMR